MTDPAANNAPLSSAHEAQLRLKRAAAALDLQIAAADLKVDNDRWKARRLMAWVSLIAILAFGAAMMFVVPTAKIDILSDVFNAITIACTTVIGAYVGSSTLAFISSMRSKITTVGTPTTQTELSDQNPFANLGGQSAKLSDLIDIDADGIQEKPPATSNTSPSTGQ